MWTPQGGTYHCPKDSQICWSGNQLAGTAIDSDRTHESHFTFCLEHLDASVFVALHNPELVRIGPSLCRRDKCELVPACCVSRPSLATPPLPILVLFICGTISIYFYGTPLTHVPHPFNKHVPHPLHVCHTLCMCATPFACVPHPLYVYHIPLINMCHTPCMCATPLTCLPHPLHVCHTSCMYATPYLYDTPYFYPTPLTSVLHPATPLIAGVHMN